MPKYLQFKEMSIIPAHAVKEGGVSLSYPMRRDDRHLLELQILGHKPALVPNQK
jgi:hypothetical protein